jgi:hypothetical protein
MSGAGHSHNSSSSNNNNSSANQANNISNNTSSGNSGKGHQLRPRPGDAVDESTDDEVDDDESRSSHSDSPQNPVSSTGFNGECMRANQPVRHNRFRPLTGSLRETGSTGNHHQHQQQQPHHPHPDSSPTHTPVPTPTQPSAGAGPQPEQCLETLLRNIEGLLAIATYNARQQQSQLHLQKGETRVIEAD